MKKEIKQLLLNDKTQEAKQQIFALISQGNQDDAELYLFLGTAYAMESNNELAIQYFNKAFEIAPDNYDVISTIANFLIANGEQKEAQQLMDNYLQSMSVKNENTFDDITQYDEDYVSAIFGDVQPPISQPEKSIEPEAEFNYLDFILGGGDAVNYEYTPKQKLNIPLPEPMIEPDPIPDPEPLPPSPPTKPRLLFTMFG